jgi:hypothetical protein
LSLSKLVQATSGSFTVFLLKWKLGLMIFLPIAQCRTI